MMQYEKENEHLKDNSRCAPIRADLKMCLLESDCCKIHKLTPRQCLNKRDSSVPDECYRLKTLFFECKRSIIDGRRRFRGPRGY